LDEPTSALDSFSEELITKAMHNLFKWRTIIIIAHRLQTVKNADDIILLANWKIIERWNHAELVKQKWVYKKMLDLQSGF
jgi:ABC-type multidrug transport system fused ATPase/permease subunit